MPRAKTKRAASAKASAPRWSKRNAKSAGPLKKWVVWSWFVDRNYPREKALISAPDTLTARKKFDAMFPDEMKATVSVARYPHEKIWPTKGTRKNPMLESVVGGLAAGTAVVAAQKLLAKKKNQMTKEERIIRVAASDILRVGSAAESGTFLMEPSKRARIIKKLLPEATRLFGKKGAKGWLRATTAAVHLPYPTPNPTVPEKHQIRIAKDTLKMSDAGARIMGGMTKEQAREILRKHGIRFKENSNGNGNGAATRRRQGSGAQAGYADFHGRSPKEVLEMTETHLQSGDYYSLGDITGLWLRKVNGDPNGWGRATLEFDKKDGVLLAASEDSNRQLYILGDDCCISLAPLRELGLDTGKQFIPLGPVYGIGYMTEKKFDGFQTTEYVHRFGDVTGEVPSAFYDKKAKRILLVGGGYSIAPLDDEMGASPGIVN